MPKPLATHYCVATTQGEMPTKPWNTHQRYPLQRAQKDLAVCQRAWPDKEWVIYRIDGLQVTGSHSGLVKAKLLEELRQRHRF